MSKAKGKKTVAQNENLQSLGLLYDPDNISPEIGLGLGRKKASKGYYEEPDEVSCSPPIETGVNEIVASCFKEIHNNIRAKKRRMEQFVSNAVTSTEVKLARCFTQANRGQNELRQRIPIRPTGNDKGAIFKLVDESRNNLVAMQQFIKKNHGMAFERALLGEVEGFHSSVEAFVQLVDRQETEQREQIFQTQQELKRELAGMEKNLIKNEMQAIQNTNF